MDARPSDAIALAVRLNSPIYVAQELLEQHAMALPAQGKNQLGKGLDSLMENRKKQKRNDEESRAAQSSLEEVKEKAYQELITFLLGSQ